jgi:putative membrane protein
LNAIAGLSRAIFAAKGWAYLVNSFFWAKIGVLVFIAVLSVRPTLKFIGWRKRFQFHSALQARDSSGRSAMIE